jgi:hypothetical protein
MFGIPPGRLLLYASAAALLVGLNLWRWGGETVAPSNRETALQGELPDLPRLAVAADFQGFSRPPIRNLFRPDVKEPEPPKAEPVRAKPPPLDAAARARREAESLLDKVDVMGFLSTSEGVMAVMMYDGAAINVTAGNKPIPGFTVSEVTIDSVTLTHSELDLSRTFELGDAN